MSYRIYGARKHYAQTGNERSRVLPKLVRMVRLEPVWITFNAVPFFFDCTEDDESIRR